MKKALPRCTKGISSEFLEASRSYKHEGSDLAHLSKTGEGMIRGDDGTQVPFRKSALSEVEFHALSSGQRVGYRIQDGWLGKEAVEIRPLLLERAAENV
jgi:cold shock CspA family protein